MPEDPSGQAPDAPQGMAPAGHAGRPEPAAPRPEDLVIARCLGAGLATMGRHAAPGAAPPGAPLPLAEQARVAAAQRTLTGWYLAKAGLPPGAIAAAAGQGAALPPTRAARRHGALAHAWREREAMALARAMAEAGRAAAPALAPRRALLVDDAADILVTVGAFLKAFGFEVIRACHADAALARLADGPAVDLLVTDHAMPGMTGKDLALQARDRHPKLRALIISGYADSADLLALPGDIALLAKPFRRADLAQAIERLFQDNGRAPASPAAPLLRG